jgi:D-3-phosphoglycerate dehydrogenase
MINEGVTPLHSAEELYATCDVISLHIPATPETKGSINHALLSHLPQGAVLVNTARKEVINEDELIQFMQIRKDFKYVTDIMPAADQKMQELFEGRYFSTPKKMGAQTAEANINAGIAAAKQIVDFFENGNTRFQVNK